MAVSTFVQPNFPAQSATVYKTSIDDAVAVHHQIGGAFAPHENSPPDLEVLLDAANFSDLVTRATVTHAAQTTGPIAGPSVDPRKDIVYVDRITGDVGVVTGAEAASPVDPTIPVGKLPVARINWTTSMTEITNTDLDDIRALGSLGLSTAAFINVGTTNGLIPTLQSDGGLELTDVDTGASFGPLLDLWRNSPSPAANDGMAFIRCLGQDDAAGTIEYAGISSFILDPAAASSTGEMNLRAKLPAGIAVIVKISDGMQVGAPSGGYQGEGTGNFENGVFQDGVAVQADLDVPSQAEAEAGTSTAERVWTAQRVSQAIAALSGGSLELLASYSPSGAASVDINSVIVPGFLKYLIYYKLQVLTDQRDLWLLSSTNNGSSFLNSANSYDLAVDFITTSGARTAFDGTGNSEIELNAGQVIGSLTSEMAAGQILIHDPTDSGSRTKVEFSTAFGTPSTVLTYAQGAAWRKANEDNDAFQIRANAGNITGEVRVYGIKES